MTQGLDRRSPMPPARPSAYDELMRFHALGLIFGLLLAPAATATAQICGDGILDYGEQCDDGNAISGDTCTNCQCGCGTLTTSIHLTCDIAANGPGDCVVLGAPGIALDCDGHAITGTGTGRGVVAIGHDGVEIRGCSISGFQTGARLDDSSSSLITRNRFTDNTTSVFISVPGGSTLDNVVVRRNFMEIPANGFGSGISVSGEFGTGTTIAWNIVRTNGFFSPGISLSGAAEVLVAHNTVTASAAQGVGIALSSASAKTIEQNTLRGLRTGVELFNATVNVLDGNILENNVSGVYFNDDTVQDNVFRRNIIRKQPSQLGLDFFCFAEGCYANDIDTSNLINTLPIHHYDGVYAPCPVGTIGPMKSGRLDLVYCSNVTAKGIAMDNGDGIHLVYPYGGRVVSANVSNSPFGVAAHYGTGVLFDENIFTDMTGPAMFLKCGIDFTATKNRVNGGLATGIWGLHLLDSEITYNEISNLGPFVFGTELGGALQLTAGSSRNLIAWNRIADNEAYGIFFVGAWYFEATSDNLITKNYVQNNAEAHDFVDLKMCGHSIDGTDRLSNNTITNNIFTLADMFPMEICNPPVCENNSVVGNIENGVVYIDSGDGCSG